MTARARVPSVGRILFGADQGARGMVLAVQWYRARHDGAQPTSAWLLRAAAAYEAVARELRRLAALHPDSGKVHRSR